MVECVGYISEIDHDKFLFHRGELLRADQLFGSHPLSDGNTSFTVYAPHAKSVHLTGDFCGWEDGLPMKRISEDGIFNVIASELTEGAMYKYLITSKTGQRLLKADPYAVCAELRPGTASKVYDLTGYEWQDKAWMRRRKMTRPLNNPINIYEMHLGSWMRKPNGSFHTYLEIAALLVPYLKEHAYTHVEMLPVMEHPYDGSWGYQTTGFFAATSRYGTPKALMAFIDACHQEGIGVIMDWVPCHFCRDAHGLAYFDGAPLYESDDPRQAINEQWGTNHFDVGRMEVRSFLLSNAYFWFEKYHVDGLRVDAVAFMLYHDYGRPSTGLSNASGGKENIEAVDFIRRMNQAISADFPGALMIAEESTTWPNVTAPVESGGLGFHLKWNMGWMNDTLKYFSLDYEQRSARHSLLTFSLMYAFSESFILPFSHDEVVHGKKSLIGRMPGDYVEKFENLKLLLCFQMTHPGKKLSFMGTELAHFIEWDYRRELDWFLLSYDRHRDFQWFTRTLNKLYLAEGALYKFDFSYAGFNWLECDNAAQSILIYERLGKIKRDTLTIVLNLQPHDYPVFRVGVSQSGEYELLLDSSERQFGGAHDRSMTSFLAEKIPWHGHNFSIQLPLFPLSCLILKKCKLKERSV